MTRAPPSARARDHFAARVAHLARGTSCSESCSCPRRTRRPAGARPRAWRDSPRRPRPASRRRRRPVAGGTQQRGHLQRRERRIRFRALALLLVETQEIGMAYEYRQQREPLADTGTALCSCRRVIWFYAGEADRRPFLSPDERARLRGSHRSQDLMEQSSAIPTFTSTLARDRSHERTPRHRITGSSWRSCGRRAFRPAIQAHHSTAEYDSATFVEAQGEVTKVLWQNPHVRLEISTERFDGVAQLWLLEGQNPGDLDRARIPRDVIKVGDTVTFAGNPSTRRERRMYVTNVLAAGPHGDRAARERAAALVAGPLLEPSAGDRRSRARGRGPRRRHLPRLAADRLRRRRTGPRDPPLTETARAAWLAYDAIRDDPVVDCTPPGMPQVITRSGRYAIRFVRAGDDIVLENEYRDIDRIIHMTADDGAARSAERRRRSAGRRASGTASRSS